MPGTWGVQKVAIAYAEYLSPEFHASGPAVPGYSMRSAPLSTWEDPEERLRCLELELMIARADLLEFTDLDAPSAAIDQNPMP